ncbi:hypothetical protein [Bacillus testis]|uniref:hypothetical protein n=1 Tax=Bacillus testis TaxID=1622072 RepID=UPI00067EF212|nr:hypothetical protein [Bacillus testis]
MNLGEAKKRALSVMAEYSIDGTLIPDNENADYLNRMNRFANDAQFEISEKIPIESSFYMEQFGNNSTGYTRYDLPKDFKEMGSMLLNGSPFLPFRVQGRSFSLPSNVTGSFELIYHKNPTELDDKTPDSYEFEVDQYAQQIIPYYMGGMALADENVTIADRLMNLYYTKLQALYKRNNDYPQTILNVFNW